MMCLKGTKIIKVIAFALSILMILQGIVWADPYAVNRSTLQIQTLFAGSNNVDGFNTIISGYLFHFLSDLERGIENQNVFALNAKIRALIKRLRTAGEIPSESLPTLGGLPEDGYLFVKSGDFIIRYYNHNIAGAEKFHPSYRLVRENKVGQYLSRQILAEKNNPESNPDNIQKQEQDMLIDEEGALELFGLSYEEFQDIIRGQQQFEKELLRTDIAFRSHIFSPRTQERFSKTLIQAVRDLTDAGVKNPLSLGLRFAIKHYYRDLKPVKLPEWEQKKWDELEKMHFPLKTLTKLPEKVPPYFTLEDSIDAKVKRALYASHPVLFSEASRSDQRLMEALTGISKEENIHLSVIYGHPFTSERQLIGHKVPAENSGILEFGYGALMKMIKNAEADPDVRFVLVIKNIEAIDPEIRTQLQEALRIGELEHPELGTIKLPENLQIIFTIREGANLEDDSFYDRVVAKSMETQKDFQQPKVELMPWKVNSGNYLRSLNIETRKSRKFLILPNAEIELSAEFKNINNKNMHDLIYAKAGLVLDFETVRMLVAMENAVKQGLPILRLEGPTGVGKTFAARGYAGLRGSSFLSDPVSEGTELTDLIGGFEQVEKGKFRFNGETSFKERAEEGGVIALSELNTLLDLNEKVSLAWWLEQINETETDEEGFRVIRLTEVPVSPDGDEHVIRIHPKTLIVIDTNPEGYEARGMFPEVFKENTAVVPVRAFISGASDRMSIEKKKIRRYADMFLKHDLTFPDGRQTNGIGDEKLRKKMTKAIVDIYYRVATAYLNKEFGKRETMVFTIRELKRMTEDMLDDISQGKEWKEALATALSSHLVARWQDSSDREHIREMIEREFLLKLPDISVEDFMAGEMFTKNRPVHLRVTPQTDIRTVFRSFQDANPGLRTKFINVTSETDRFMLEGGPIIGEDGETQEFGHGILGRLILEAEAAPDEQIVYVLDNIHNLRPEEAVALNEFLQEGKLYLKGRDTRMTRPANAHVLVVTRSDSVWEWSEAEKSRYVTFGYDGLSRFEKRMTEILDEALESRWIPEELRRLLMKEEIGKRLDEVFESEALLEEIRKLLVRGQVGDIIEEALDMRHVPDEIKRIFISDMLELYTRYIRYLVEGARRYDMQSQTAFLRMAEGLSRRIREYPEGQLDIEKICKLVEDCLDEYIFIGFPPEERTMLRGRFLYSFRLLSVAFAWAESENRKAGEHPETWASQLAMAKVWFKQAGSDEEKRAWLKPMKDIVKRYEAEIDLVETDRSSINPLDIGKAHFEDRTYKPADHAFAGVWDAKYSHDGKKIIAGIGGQTGEECGAFIYVLNENTGEFEIKQTLDDPIDIVWTVDFSPDDKKLIVGSRDGKAYLYELNERNGRYFIKQTFEKKYGGGIMTVRFFPRSGRILIGGRNDKASVYKYDDTERKYKKIQELEHPDGVLSASISRCPLGNTIITGCEDGKLRLFVEEENGQYKLMQEVGHGRWVWSVSHAPDGLSFLAGLEGGSVLLYGYDSFHKRYILKQIFRDHNKVVSSVSFSPDGKGIVTSSWEGTVCLYALDIPEDRYALKQEMAHVMASEKDAEVYYSSSVGSAMFSPDGDNILTGSWDKHIRIFSPQPFIVKDEREGWEINTGQSFPLSNLHKKINVLDTEIAGMPWPQRLARSKVLLEHAEEDEEISAQISSIKTIMTKHGRKFGRRTVEPRKMNRLETGQAFFETGIPFSGEEFHRVRFSRDGTKCLASDEGGKIYLFSRDEDRNWKTAQEFEFEYDDEFFGEMDFSPDGNSFLVCGSYNAVYLFSLDPDSGLYEEKQKFDDSTARVNSVRFSNDGKKIITGSLTKDNKVRVYAFSEDEKTFELKQVFQHEGWVRALCFSPDGKRIATGSDDVFMRIYTYDEQIDKYVPSQKIQQEYLVDGVEFSPDGRRIGVTIWNAATKLYLLDEDNDEFKEETTLNRWGSSLDFSPNGRYLVIGSFDGDATLYIYDDEDGEYVYYKGLAGDRNIHDVQFTANGTRMYIHDTRNKNVEELELHPFIIKDEQILYDIETGEIHGRYEVPGLVELLDAEPHISVYQRQAEPARFDQRYIDKPFYFCADRSGSVYLNYKDNWFVTRHELIYKDFDTSNKRDQELVNINGEMRELYPVDIENIRNPCVTDRIQPLDSGDFLMDTDVLEEVELSVLNVFSHGRHVDLEGASGAGKTSIAKEIAFLLGLPRHVFQMHGERELSDLIGSARENSEGKIFLSNKPLPVFLADLQSSVPFDISTRLIGAGILKMDKDGKKVNWDSSIYTNIDLENAVKEKLPGSSPDEKAQIMSLIHYRQPLLEFLTHGGVFIADEGAIGEQGRDLLSWFSSIVSGDEIVYLEEFPGHEMMTKVHSDFHLIITNNLPEKTHAREMLRSEISSNLHYIYVDEDDSFDTLCSLFKYFLGKGPAVDHDATKDAIGKELMAGLLAEFHLRIKSLIGKELGKEDKIRHHISKREIRRVAQQVRKPLLTENIGNVDLLYEFYKACRTVYEAGFSHSHERKIVQDILHGLIDEVFKEQKVLSGDLLTRFNREVRNEYASRVTGHEAWVAWVTDQVLDQDDPILFISEHGARTGDILHFAAFRRGADMEVIDAAPEHTELEILGGLLPCFGKKEEGRISRFARGRITRYLFKQEEMDQLRREDREQKEMLVWIRNIDQWNEDLRTSLNGLLEDGYIDLETEEGRIERFFKPDHVHFVSEISSESAEEFSSAFFNRWINIGVSHELPVVEENEETSKFEQVLRTSYGLDQQEAFYLKMIYELTLEHDRSRMWSGRASYDISPEIFYMIAESVKLAKGEDSAWKDMLEDIPRTGYDPRQNFGRDPPGAAEKAVKDQYEMISRVILLDEILAILGVRFSQDKFHTGVSDQERFREILKIVFDLEHAPSLDTRVRTKDGTFNTPIIEVDMMPFRSREKGLPPRQVSKKHKIRFDTKEMGKGLSVLSRAEKLSRGVLFVGESGTAKTSLAGFYAEITGRKFYKYQCHGGSEYTDLTMDVEQTPDGGLKKRVKKLYQHLREGNVVIDIDEANISPHILWALEPVLRGEKIVHPIFPEEEPFEIGEDVVLVFTMNPERYAARKEIDRRLTDRMITCRMDLPDDEDRLKIGESFYGVWNFEKKASPKRREEPEEKKKVIEIEYDIPEMIRSAERFDPSEFKSPKEAYFYFARNIMRDFLASLHKNYNENTKKDVFEAARKLDEKLKDRLEEFANMYELPRIERDDMKERLLDLRGFFLPKGVYLNVGYAQKEVNTRAYIFAEPEMITRTRKFTKTHFRTLGLAPEKYADCDVKALFVPGIISREEAAGIFVGDYAVVFENKAAEELPDVPIPETIMWTAWHEFGHVIDHLRNRKGVGQLAQNLELSSHLLPMIFSKYSREYVLWEIGMGLIQKMDEPESMYFQALKGILNGLIIAFKEDYLIDEELELITDNAEVDRLTAVINAVRDMDEQASRRLNRIGAKLYKNPEKYLYTAAPGKSQAKVARGARAGTFTPGTSLKGDVEYKHDEVEVKTPEDGTEAPPMIEPEKKTDVLDEEAAEQEKMELPETGQPEPSEAEKQKGAPEISEGAQPTEGQAKKEGSPRERATDGNLGEGRPTGGARGGEEKGEGQAKKEAPPRERAEGPPGTRLDLSHWDEMEQRIQEKFSSHTKKLKADVILNDKFASFFLSGAGDTEFIFRRMLKAIQSRERIIKKMKKTGIEVDPVAIMLGKPKPFVSRKKRPKMQTTAAAVLLDFSSSMKDMTSELTFTVGTVGENFWKLREQASKYFFYDLSYFTDDPPVTVVQMGERVSEDENRNRMISMSNMIARDGTNIQLAMEEKLTNEKGTGFLDSREALNAKKKYMILFTDGVDRRCIRVSSDGSYELTETFNETLKKYQDAGIDVIVLGIGEASEQVRAFKGYGQHYVRIARDRPFDIAEAIAKITEHKCRGTGILPDGDITDFFQIGNVGYEKAVTPRTAAIHAFKRIFYPRLSYKEYAIKKAPWLESAIFKGIPFLVLSIFMIAGRMGIWEFMAGMAISHFLFVILHGSDIKTPLSIIPFTFAATAYSGMLIDFLLTLGLPYYITIPIAILFTGGIYLFSSRYHRTVNKEEFSEPDTHDAKIEPGAEDQRRSEEPKEPESKEEVIIKDAEKTIYNLVHALTGAAEKSGKVVLAIDTELGEGEIHRQVEKLIQMLPSLENNNRHLRNFLKNLVIRKGKGRELARMINNITDSERGSVKPENVIIISKVSHIEHFDSVKDRAIIAGIDDAGFPETAYLPLLEIMLFTVSKYLGGEASLEEYYEMIPNVLSMDALGEGDHNALFDRDAKTFIIRLVPDAEPFDKEELRELMKQIRLILSRA